MLSRLLAKVKGSKEPEQLAFNLSEYTQVPQKFPAGYLFNHPTGLIGVQGYGMDYVVGKGGLYVQARNETLTARVPLGVFVPVKGLADVSPKVELKHGPIHGLLFDLALDMVTRDTSTERYASIVYGPDDRYYVMEPVQETTPTSVKYEREANTVFEIHSHGRMAAFFSGTDTKDEQGLGIYAVVGNVGSAEERQSFVIRVGVYGYFWNLMEHPEWLTKVFDPFPKFIANRLGERIVQAKE